MKRFIIKKTTSNKSKFDKGNLTNKKNNILEKNNTMDNKQIEKIQNILMNVDDTKNERPIKKIKKDKSIIERSESSKIVINEDNKQLLID